MRNYRDAKAMAATLRRAFQDKQISLSHSECLEIVARQFGFQNWNVLADKIGMASSPALSGLSRPDGWWLSGSRPDLYDIGVEPDVR